MTENKDHQGGAVNPGFNFGENTSFGDGTTFFDCAGANNVVVVNDFGGKKSSTKNHTNEETAKCTDEALRAHQEQVLNEKILQYVGKAIDFVDDSWKKKYFLLWKAILKIPAVQNIIYNPGTQQNTPFNRKLVGNVFYLLKKNGVIKSETTDRNLAFALEGKRDASIRINMGQKPDSNEISDNVKKLISNPEELGDETPPT